MKCPAGVIKGGVGLRPAAEATTVRVRDGDEIGGFSVLNSLSFPEGIRRLRRA
ncbi:hypothetical protein [Nonomuraea sp. SYSU D8015]|uniref:hypothetical protein n=1 Tax=Nonomuraea sp. SYSU D8015 TaxID=2593644 RepID=UPI0016613B62|nr:hypothetical protein [Nonomuraea sp. SYSU D8015]